MFEILENLSEENKKRIRICHSFNPNGKTQDQVVQEHADSTKRSSTFIVIMGRELI